VTVQLLEPPSAIADRPPDDSDGRPARPGLVARIVTVLVTGIPFVALVLAVTGVWGSGLGLRDALLAVSLYFLTGFGITLGYHRLLTHRAFVARRPLKIALVALGSMGFEGGPIEWVANHRRHHAYTDREGDPHSPHVGGASARGVIAGLWHAHAGWLFTASPTSSRRFARDLWRDRDVVVLNRLFPVWCVVSLGVPFGLGWALGGSAAAAISALLWAGLIRVCVLHHTTWSINSICHVFGRRPFATSDRSGNVRVLSLLSMGESWHNGHHAFPRSARHGLLHGQWDMAGRLIRVFEQVGWATDVQWPTAQAIAKRRRA